MPAETLTGPTGTTPDLIYELDVRGHRRTPSTKPRRPPATKGRTLPPDPLMIIRCGKGGKRRLVVMDAWAWKAIEPWLDARLALRPGQIFCVLDGPTEGRAMHDSDVRRQLCQLQLRSGVRRRVAAHQMRHSHAVDLQREGLDLLAIQAQLGHANPGVTMIYLRSIAVEERLAPIAARKPPMMMLPT